MAQNSLKSSSSQEDTLPHLILIVFVGAILITFLPVMTFSMVFAYLSYISFYEKEERKWIRSVIILAF